MNNGNKTIFKNTIFLNLRMIVTIAVGLYTSRVVLQTLGASDFGIYTLVGGIVLMASFLNVGMMQASQRFLSYSIGKGDEEDIRQTFSTSVYTHLIISAIVILFAETIGLYIIQHLNIPSERMWAANWVYQCSVATFVVSVVSVPYNSCVVAHEKMDFYAYTSILETLLKLGILYLLLWSPWDKLATYAMLFLCVQVVVRFIYSIYCSRHFAECRKRLVFNKEKMLKMFSFAGWSALGNFGFSFRDQGVSIILNLFMGTIVNAARGVATSVSTIINGFATNLTLAINPQIVKQYAAGNYEESATLVYAGSRIAFFIMMVITIPFLIHAPYILELWLGTVPEHTTLFLYFILAVSMIYSLSQPVTVALQATGHIKTFQIWVCSLMMLELVLTYVAMYFTGNLIYALWPAVITNIMALIVRFQILKQKVQQYEWKKYLWQVVLRCCGLYAICMSIMLVLHHYCIGEDSFLSVILCVPMEISIVAFAIIALGLEKTERDFVFNKVKKVLHLT